MGALVNFISHSVIVGFTAGAAVLIAAKQLKHFFGVEIDSSGHLHDILLNFGSHIVDINPYATAVAIATLLSGIAIKRWLPKLPYLIICMVFGGIVAYVLNLLYGDGVTHIAQVGALPSRLPPLSTPDFNPDHIKALAPTALAVTLFALTEAVSIGRSLAARGGYRIDGNQEFIGQGISNIAGSFFSGYVATGSFNRSGLNYEAGARTPLAAIFAGALLMVIVLLVAPLAAYLPKAAMAAVLFMVAWGLIDLVEMRHILHASKREIAVLAVTLLSALFLELEFAIFAGVLLSLVLYLERTSKPTLLERVPDPRLPGRPLVTDPDLPECPQFRIVRINGSIFFGSVSHVQDAFDRFRAEDPERKHLAVTARGINFVDLQGGEALVEEAKRRRADGGAMYLMNVKRGLWDDMERCGCLDEIGPNRVFAGKNAGIRAVYQKLDKSRCAVCDKRIFLECQTEFGPAPRRAGA
jgi:SulP family sulfate permease